VCAGKGPDAAVIDDFIRGAGAACGTFCNHFASAEELLDAATKLCADNAMRWILAAIGEITDPALRFAAGMRRWSQVDKVGCEFVLRSRFRGPRPPTLAHVRSVRGTRSWACGARRAQGRLALAPLRRHRHGRRRTHVTAMVVAGPQQAGQ
jgi:AcrR family transcriptional regulator